MLLLDNNFGHPKEELHSKDMQIQVLYMSPSMIQLFQPVDQNMIQQIQINYKNYLLSYIIQQNDGIVNFKKKINIKALFLI